MGQKGLTYILTASLIGFCLYALLEARRPLCVDSKWIREVEYKSSSSSSGKTERLFSCDRNRDFGYQPFFAKNLVEIQDHINRTELLLSRFSPFRQKLKVTINAQQPVAFRILDHHLEIGSDLLNAEGHFEKGLYKIWYRDNTGSWFATNSLFEEVITDFFLFINRGDISLTDPVHHFRTRTGGAKWPQVIKSVQGYCESSWRLSEHYEKCLNVRDDENAFHANIVQLSLRPLVSSAWIKAFKDLSYNERKEFLHLLPVLLKTNTSTDPERMLAQAINSESPVQQAISSVRRFNALMSATYQQSNASVHRVFTSFFANDLRQSGLNDAFADAFFDVIIYTDQSVGPKSELLNAFKAVSKRNPNVQMALIDNENLWMLPSDYPVSLKSFGQVRSTKMIVSRCGGFDFNYILGFSSMTEKLLVVNKCGALTGLNFGEFFEGGVAGFARKNKNVAFIQFHLPSLNLRKDQLASVQNVYELIERRNTESPVFQALGWNELKWDQQLQAYRPQAHVDGIELFRTRPIDN